MLAGHTVTIWVSIGGALLGRKHPTLPFSTEECSDDIWAQVNKTAVILARNATTPVLEDVPWPQKIYTVSFLLYPLIGCSVTIIVGSIVSLLTCGKGYNKGQEKYTHPLLAKILRKVLQLDDNENEDKISGPKGMQLQMSENTNGVKLYPDLNTNGTYTRTNGATATNLKNNNGPDKSHVNEAFVIENDYYSIRGRKNVVSNGVSS